VRKYLEAAREAYRRIEREGGTGVETRGRKLGVVEIYATATSDLSFTSI